MTARDLPTTKQPNNPIAHQHLKAAADWFAQLRDGEADEKIRQDWRDWLQQHDDHQAAWDYVTAVGQRFELFQVDTQGRTAASVLQDRQHRRLTRRKLLGALVGVTGAGLASWAGYSWTPLPALLAAWQADQRTATGEVRELALTGGARLWLNTASAVNTNTSHGVQQLSLLQGEIFIATGGKTRYPLRVTTRQGRMQPLGTQFVVRQQDQATLVAVYQGVVEIHTATSAERRRIEAGQQVAFTATRVSAIEAADPARRAWVHGILLAENITLDALVTELARYQRGYLDVSPEVASLRVLGGYPLRDPAKTLTMLAEILPIRVHRPLPFWTRIEPAR
jgi:transmembrane sensor